MLGFEHEEYIQNKYENMKTTLPNQEQVLHNTMYQCEEGLVVGSHH